MFEPNYKELDSNSLKIVDKIPRLINVCCRTEESLNQLFDFIENNPNKITRDFLALITDTMKIKPTLNSSGFPFRGLMKVFFTEYKTRIIFSIIRFNAYKESQWTRKISI